MLYNKHMSTKTQKTVSATLFQNSWDTVSKVNLKKTMQTLFFFCKYTHILNLMPATHSKKVGTGRVYHCITSPFLFITFSKCLGLTTLIADVLKVKFVSFLA